MKAMTAVTTAFAVSLAIALLLAPASVAATPKPSWTIQSLAEPTNFAPGEESGKDLYEVFVTNTGGAVTDGTPIEIVDTLPEGIGVQDLDLRIRSAAATSDGTTSNAAPVACETDVSGNVSTVTCTVDGALSWMEEPTSIHPSEQILLAIRVKVPPEAVGQLTNQVEVQGGGAETVAASSLNEAGTEEASSGFQEFQSTLIDSAGEPVTGADSHPYAYVNAFGINTELAPPGSPFPFRPAGGDIKDIEVPLPPGLLANPTATERCSALEFNTVDSVVIGGSSGISLNHCPDASAVGVIAIEQLEGSGRLTQTPIYNLEPPKGMPAQLGFQILGLPIYINARLRSDGDYGVTGYLQNLSQAKRVTASLVTLWGVPWDDDHDPLRGHCAQIPGTSCPADESAPRPFWRLPSSCGAQLPFSMSFDTWLDPGNFQLASLTNPAPVDCDLPPFEPSIEAKPTTNVADAPSGLHFDLHLPQAANDDPDGLAHADLRDARVTLPEGLVVNPSSADGLAACSLSQIGYTGIKEGRHSFSASPANCPNASKIGNVQVDTPLVDHPLPGAVYLATPHDNPFGNLITIYIAIDDPQTGVVVKLAGEVTADPNTGRLTTTVEQNPQVPFEDFTFDFFEGARAPLRTPSACGTHTTTTELTPWTAPAGSTAFPTDSFETSAPAPGQSSCPSSAAGLPNAPSFAAGTATPTAGAFSPMLVNLRRGDGTQEFGKLTLNPPPGLLARLAGIPYCSEAALAAAANGSGRQEQASPACPAASQVGTVTVGAGAGPAPYYAQGKAYLAGPYKGAPLSLAILTPAVAGPFDLGTVVVRTALHVDPVTTRITAVSDPIPHILEGIPLDVRSVSVKLDHDGWGLNPTSCDPSSFGGDLLSTLGNTVPISNRFQVGSCAELGFKPKLSLQLKGKTKRGGFPALRAVYAPRAGDANLRSMVLRFPKSEFIEQGHFRTICTRVQWAAGAGGGAECPKGSVYGHVRATTPLLDKPLEGPVYLRSSDHELPDVVFALRGQVSAEVAVQVDSVKGGLRASIESAPDVPVSKVVLNMQGGQKGLFVNSRDVCAHSFRAAANLGAQSGKALTLKPAMKAKCGGKEKRKGSKGHR